MRARVVAAGVVAVWLLLFGIELSEAAGLIDRVDKDKSVEAQAAGFGVAFRVLDDSRQTLSAALNVQLQSVPILADFSVFRSREGSGQRNQIQLLKERLKIHRLHKVLLI